jgi:hypothetical protein
LRRGVRVKRQPALAALAAAAFLALPNGAAASRTLALSVIHYVRGCHVWKTSGTLGPSATVTVQHGTTLRIRISCPMDFDVAQTAGPRLRLGGPRVYAGTTRAIAFARPGLYRLTARNVQTSEEQGLETLGPDNTLRLTVRVK